MTDPGKYLFVAPGQDKPEAEGFKIFESPTNSILLGIRLMSKDREKRIARATRKNAGSLRRRPTLKQNQVIYDIITCDVSG